MARKPIPEPQFHRLQYEEGGLAVPVDLSTLDIGDVCVRQGSPCMVIGPSNFLPVHNPFVVPNKVWVVNLVDGLACPIPANEKVYPAFNVKLTFDTTRRND